MTEKQKTIKNKKKIAFVASGGAVKAACFHIGVMLAMKRFGFDFKGGLKEDSPLPPKDGEVSIYVGSSAGAFTTGLVAGGYTPEELYENLNKKGNNESKIRPLQYFDLLGSNFSRNLKSYANSIFNSKKFKTLSIEGFIHTLLGFNGAFTTGNVGKYLKNVMPSNNFQDLASELYFVTTELDNPNRIIFGPKKLEPSMKPADFETDVGISEAAIGSMSLPGIFGSHKVNIRGKDVPVFDGEVRHTMSTHVAKDAGADLIIASYTHQPYHYNPEYGSLANYGLPVILVQTIYQMVESRIAAAKRRHEIKLDAVDEVSKFFKENDLPKKLRDELVEKMQKRLGYRTDLDYIYINPEPTDSRMFFEDHFNLSVESMGRIIRSGFKSAYHKLCEYKFDFSNEGSNKNKNKENDENDNILKFGK